MSEKYRSEHVCKGDKYAKASLSIQIFFVVLILVGVVVAITYLGPYLSQLQNLGNVLGQIPSP